MTILSMIFLSIVDDWYLQGVMKNTKQKIWWDENITDIKLRYLYRYDYIWVILTHAFSWTFMTMFPIMIVMNFELNGMFALWFIGNLLIHAYVDNLKSNKLKISVMTDQTIHLIQILITYTVLCVILQ